MHQVTLPVPRVALEWENTTKANDMLAYASDLATPTALVRALVAVASIPLSHTDPKLPRVTKGLDLFRSFPNISGEEMEDTATELLSFFYPKPWDTTHDDLSAYQRQAASLVYNLANVLLCGADQREFYINSVVATAALLETANQSCDDALALVDLWGEFGSKLDETVLGEFSNTVRANIDIRDLEEVQSFRVLMQETSIVS